MFFKSNDGAKIEYDVHGDGKGKKTVIMLHGWGIGKSFFSEQIPPLVKEGYKVVTMNAVFMESHPAAKNIINNLKTNY